MSKRTYLSGYEKRKLRKEKEESIKKLPSVAKYFASNSAEEQKQPGMPINCESLVFYC